MGRTEKSRLESCNPFIPSAADVSGGAMDPAHPSGGFCTFISGGRVDQSQPLRASIGWTRELILVHQDEVKGQTQLLQNWNLSLKRIPLG